ncbi:MAG: sigma-70 family RNA polymerase sigma factor [Reyranella sp.]|uniref:RNA polymerase sigma factor n=1 Tax=Reyranella sp. TaxID=1929291 RepID=UPI000A7914EE|nr:sigma-70 family RNA polymerase sigma factor [Reyranella sp.]MBR2820084.1 sigma-70 family RNA polymerase sigma factor [Reyranella sp.]
MAPADPIPADSTLAIYIEHRDRLLTYAARIVRSRASAEDIVQEAWLRFSARARQGSEIAQPQGYLYRIVRNLALNWAKRTTRHGPIDVPEPVMEGVAADLPSAEQVLVYRDELRLLEDSIAELPERTQTAFYLYRIEGRSLQDIANELNISVVRVHQLVKEAGLHAARRLFGDET